MGEFKSKEAKLDGLRAGEIVSSRLYPDVSETLGTAARTRLVLVCGDFRSSGDTAYIQSARKIMEDISEVAGTATHVRLQHPRLQQL